MGSILGGILVAELSWRWVLFINVPIGLAAMVAALVYLPELRRTGARPRLDVAGAVTVTAGLATLAYAIVSTDTSPWGSARTLLTLALAAALLGVFLFIQLRVATEPLVPLTLFRSRSVSGSNIVMFLIGAAFFSMWYFLSLYMQNVLGFSALRTGLAFVPMALAIIVGAQTSSRLLSRTGVRPLLFLGTVLATAGFVWLSHIQATSSYWDAVFGPGTAVALALGLLFTPLAHAATAGVAQHEAGLASGVLNTSRQVGGSIGLAVLATVATTHTKDALSSHAAVSLDAALAHGYAQAFTVAAFLTGAAFLAAFLVPRLGRRPGEAVDGRLANPSLGPEPA